VPVYAGSAVGGPVLGTPDALCDFVGWVAPAGGRMPTISRTGGGGGLFMTGHTVALDIDDDMGAADAACARVTAGMREPVTGQAPQRAAAAPARSSPSHAAAAAAPEMPAAAAHSTTAAAGATSAPAGVSGDGASGGGSGAVPRTTSAGSGAVPETYIPQTYKYVAWRSM
jgi:hypothetical protein